MDTVSLSGNLDLSRCGRPAPPVPMSLSEACLTETYGLCWALKAVPGPRVFRDEVTGLYYQVLRLTRGVCAFLCRKQGEIREAPHCVRQPQSLSGVAWSVGLGPAGRTCTLGQCAVLLPSAAHRRPQWEFSASVGRQEEKAASCGPVFSWRESAGHECLRFAPGDGAPRKAHWPPHPPICPPGHSVSYRPSRWVSVEVVLLELSSHHSDHYKNGWRNDESEVG